MISFATLQGAALATEAEAMAERNFSNSHPIYAMPFDLQALSVVRIIENRN
jgi:adenine-specific DNA-methyltransferase